MKTIIVASSIPPTKSLLTKLLSKASLLIAVDGGANCLFDYQIQPDLLIGDLDSIQSNVLMHYQKHHIAIEKFPCEKDCSDTALALKKALERGATDIVFLGCMGNRLDHLLCNVGLLKKCLSLNIAACLQDENQIITLTNQSCVLKGKAGTIFSLEAYSDHVQNLSIQHSKYPLKNYDLIKGTSLTLSNEFLNQPVKINFSTGYLLIMRYFST